MRVIALLLACLVPLALATCKAPLTNRDSQDVIPDSYLVVLKKSVGLDQAKSHYDFMRDTARKLDKDHRGVVKTFDSIGGVYSYHMECNDKVLAAIRGSPLVDYVAQDGHVTMQAAFPTTPMQIRDETAPVQPWSLGRISNRQKGINNFLSVRPPQTFLYALDTGVRLTHKEFGGRALFGANFIDGSPNTDENGHGTHTAATAAGNTVGVDNATTIIAVKCLDKNSSGTWSGLMAAINWAVGDAQKRKAVGRSVINMSIGGDVYQPLDDMIERAYQANMTIVVAACNYGADACKYSPARAPNAITVAATDRSDARASWSNWGACVKLFAPGVDISSAWLTSDASYATLSGTSMASPHVAGLATYLMSREGLVGPQAVRSRIIRLATPNMVTDPKNSPNLISYNGGLVGN